MRSQTLFILTVSLSLLTVLPGCFEDYDLQQVERMDKAELADEVGDCDDFVDLLDHYAVDPDALADLVDGERYAAAEDLMRDGGLYLTDGAFEDLLDHVDDCLIDG